MVNVYMSMEMKTLLVITLVSMLKIATMAMDKNGLLLMDKYTMWHLTNALTWMQIMGMIMDLIIYFFEGINRVSSFSRCLNGTFP